MVTGDDTADVWVNGTQVSTSPRVTDSWKTAAVVDLTGRLSAGTNVIAVRAENTTQSPAGVVATLSVQVDRRSSPTGRGRRARTGPPAGSSPGSTTAHGPPRGR